MGGRSQRDEGYTTIFFPASSGAQGTTGTWSIANNTATAKCAASQTAATFIIPLSFERGDTIVKYKVSGQMESAANDNKCAWDLRATTAAAGDLSDASIGAISQITKTADYKIIDESAALDHVVITGNSYYLLTTATTAANTDIDFQGVEVTILRKD